MSKNVDAGDFYYEGQEVARQPYYISARSSKSGYNRARADIRPDAAPIEVSADFFGFMFGQQPATISSPSDRRLPDFPEIRNSSLDELSIVESSLNDFESGVRSLSKNAQQYEARVEEINNGVLETYKTEGALDLFEQNVIPFVDNTNSWIVKQTNEIKQVTRSLETTTEKCNGIISNQQEENNHESTHEADDLAEDFDSCDFNSNESLSDLENDIQKKTEMDLDLEDYLSLDSDTRHATYTKEVVLSYARLECKEDRRKLLKERDIVSKKVDLTYEAVDNLTSEDYILSRQNFFYLRERNNKKPDIPMSVLDEMNEDDRALVVDILNFLDVKTKPPDGFSVPKIAYCPSGGGKTTMVSRSSRSHEYLDVDDICAAFYDEFTVFRNFLDKLKTQGPLMDKFFKYMLHHNPDLYENKILLMCHPKQVPHYMRGYGNELILIPVVMNWNVRFFRYNLFSLLGVMGKPKILAHYDEYELIVRNHFKLP